MTDRDLLQQARDALADVATWAPANRLARADAVIAAINARLAQPAEQAQCVGRDPYCPCQDGDACHYVDTPGSPAMPIPPAQPAEQAQPARNRVAEREADRARYSDPEFNKWLDQGIADGGLTVWDAVDTYSAYCGWTEREAVMQLAEQAQPAVCQHIRSSDEGTQYCDLAAETGAEIDRLRAEVADLATLAARMARALRKGADRALADQAVDYLSRHKLLSPLRDALKAQEGKS